jgi:hypothetical protein
LCKINHDNSIIIPTTTEITPNYLFTDVWGDININDVSRPDVSLNFQLRDSLEYYNIGNSDFLPKKIGISVAGISSQEKIKRGDIRKIIVSTRIPYTVEQTQYVDNLKYRIYVKEGKNELTVIDFEQIQTRMTNLIINIGFIR